MDQLHLPVKMLLKIGFLFLGFSVLFVILLIWRDARKHWRE